MFCLKIWISGILLLIFTPRQIVSTKIECKFTEKCRCFLEGLGSYEFQCPPEEDTNRVVLHIEPENKIKIDCYDLKIFNVSILPDLKLDKIKTLDLTACPLPVRFKDIFDKFQLNGIRFLKFRYGNLTNIRLNKDIFEGLENLEHLSLEDNNLVDLDEDVFENTPNLTYIDLGSNRIKLTANLFQTTLNLRWIGLYSNKLNSLPDGLFDNLYNLEVLHLWTNNLAHLNKDIFSSLTKLASLELSKNKLESLDEYLFSNLTQLVNFSVMSNNLKTLPGNLFRFNEKLETVRVGYNPNLTLPDHLFANLRFLKDVQLRQLNLIGIPETIFENSTNLRSVDLSGNKLETLPEKLFRNFNLKEISLKNNAIKRLPDNIFSSLRILENLYLEHNLLEEIREPLFEDLSNLQKLHLQANRIKNISRSAFKNNPHLVVINLAHNELTFESSLFDWTPFNNCVDLEVLDLSYNKITDFDYNFINKIYLKQVHLNNNNISYIEITDILSTSKYDLEIDLTNNQITDVSFGPIRSEQESSDSRRRNEEILIYLDKNPINCNCKMLSLSQYLYGLVDPKIKEMYKIVANELTCAQPPSFKNKLLKNVPFSKLTCLIEEIDKDYKCPEMCSCYSRSFDKAVVIDCSYQNLTTIPPINLPRTVSYNHTELLLQGNKLETVPERIMNFDNITVLNLSHNQLKNVTRLPLKLKVLYLDNNQLERLNDRVLMNLSSISKLSLDQNPWVCDCKAINLTNFIRKNLKHMMDSNIKCYKTEKLLLDQTEALLCHFQAWLYILIMGLILATISAILAALYYRYQVEIKIWLYARNLCLWWVTEDELDKDKTFDAFVSYSHKDEDFLAEYLLPVLENKESPYKLCLHFRHWVPGDPITDQVIRSVLDSRRTIVILSENFLESVWGKMEFRTAHQQAMSEGRARVIVILYGDVDIEKLDDVLKTYLKSNTYVKWGDPWFWDKLKYAMPHSKGFRKSNLKHASMMAKIDEKFNLKVIENSETTPPVLKMEKKNPLDFVSTEENSLVKTAV